jgi:hypothetical protein
VEQENSVNIALAMIKRYGHQAEAVAEEKAAIMAQEDPGSSHVWAQIPSVIAELRRSQSAPKTQPNK